MPNTKLTKAKQPDNCPFCNKVTTEPWQDHVILCSGQRFKCLECGARFKKNGYLLKHMKKHESSMVAVTPMKKQKYEASTKRMEDSTFSIPVPTVSEPAIDESSGEHSDWETQDPGDLDDVLGSCSESDVENSGTTESKDQSALELEVGRVIRKRTQPTLFTGPKPKSTIGSDDATPEKTGDIEKSTTEKSIQTELLLFACSTKKITTQWENGKKIKTIEKKKYLSLD